MLFPLFHHEWELCRASKCTAPNLVDDIQGRLGARLWLQQLKGDPLKMRVLRDFLIRDFPLPPSRVADETVLEQIADLLITGRLHLHAAKMEIYAAGSMVRAEESAVAFPISEHKRRDPEPAPQFVDLPSFPANGNLAAQAAALVGAAAAGIPFCPV
jgi:hypothetical protein